MECPIGKIKRNSYTKKLSSGKKIKISENCIDSTSDSGLKRTDIDKKKIGYEKREHNIARKKFGTPKCSNKEIVKEGYYKKSPKKKSKGTWVSPVCIKAKGSSKKRGTKGKKLFRLEKGTLSQYGYSGVKKLSKTQRRNSLSKAIKNMKPLSVMRKLIAVSTLQKNTNPQMSKIFKEDAEFVKSTKEYKAQSKS
jgi:hypothetical protein